MRKDSLLGQVLLIPALAMILAATACKEEQVQHQAPPPAAVTINKPEIRDMVAQATYTGTTQAIQSVEIRARVEGYLREILFQPGSYVEKGQVLFVIDPQIYQARLNEIKADLAIREAELELTRATLDRNEAALKDNAVSEVAVIQARAARSTAQAAVEAARARVESAELDLSYTKVTSPVSGRISRHLVDVGNLVGANEATILANVVNDSSIYAYFTISENDLLRFRQQLAEGKINANPKVVMTLSDTEKSFDGSIDYIDNRVDMETGTIGIRAVFPNKDHQLLPGLFARLKVPVNRYENAMMVVEEAFGQDQQGFYLLTVNDQNIVEHHPVKVGPVINGYRPVESGITPEDRVIINGLLKAQPGSVVAPMSPEQASAPTAAAN